MINFLSRIAQSIKSIFEPLVIKDPLEKIDLSQFFPPDELIELERIIANEPENREIVLRLTQAISNHDIADIFYQLGQLKIDRSTWEPENG